MKRLAVIPARYQSTRFKGKPLVDIFGKPMIWWVYQRVSQVKEFDKIVVATDNDQIKDTCKKYNLNVLMTSEDHKTSTERVFEVAQTFSADLYVVINGDEPLIEPDTLRQIIPDKSEIDPDEYYVANLITKIERANEVIDPSNIKVVTDLNGDSLCMSRSPIPFPQSSKKFSYMKHVGVLAYNYKALDFFNNSNAGTLELVEKINELRFIEHGIKIKLIETASDTISVDTPKDLEKVLELIKENNLIPSK
jgi:3-deoxy-manno-octulosonate cytidylyltransferase (CMP-KDO synthetase)